MPWSRDIAESAPLDRARSYAFSLPWPWRAGLAAVVVLGATFLQWLVADHLRGALYLVYYPSVFVIALFLGPAIAVAAAAVEAALAAAFFLAPSDGVALWLRPLFFFGVAAFVAIVVDGVLRSRSKVRHLQQQLQLLFDSNLIGIVAWNVAGGITEANDAFLRMIGTDRKALREGKVDWRRLTPPEYAPVDAAAIERLRAEGQHPPYEKEFFRKDGSRVPIVVGSAHFPGSRNSGFSFILDNTRQVAAQKQLLQTRDELRSRVEALDRSNADLAQFAFVASHDLKEPLRVVRIHLQFLERHFGAELPPKAHEHLQVVLDAATRMYQLVDDLLEYARVGVGSPSPSRVDVDAICRDVVRGFAATVAECGGKVSVEALPEAAGDDTEVRQLIHNLLGNALKFRDGKPPEIRVASVASDAEFHTYSVSDNGIGVPPEYASRIFEIFQRLHDRGRYPGTGIGLSLCKKIVERRGGRIWVQPSALGGSDFRFSLPRVKESS